jgi:hypothetical protein
MHPAGAGKYWRAKVKGRRLMSSAGLCAALAFWPW